MLVLEETKHEERKVGVVGLEGGSWDVLDMENNSSTSLGRKKRLSN